jgi:Domain of unknown function (DUF4156)
MKKTVYCFVLVVSAMVASACSWVKVSEAGKQVHILPASRVADCVKIGTISTSVKDKIIGIERNNDKVRTELDRLARDQAVLMNANSLVRAAIKDGEGSYIAYRCP